MKYQVTFRYGKDNQFPTDFLHVPASAQLIDCRLIKNTTRRQVWEYEYNAEHSGAIEAAFDSCSPVIRWKQVATR